MSSNKKTNINIRITPEFKTLAESQMRRFGFSNMSEFIRILIVNADKVLPEVSEELRKPLPETE